MKNIGIASILAGAFAAAAIGFSGAAQAEVSVANLHEIVSLDRDRGVYDGDSNYPWRDQLIPQVRVPNVDTSIRN